MAKKEFKYSTSCFIGHTDDNPIPVFWDAHTQIYNVGAPVTLITGESGSGKTFFLLYLTCQNILCGSTTVALDVKGDLIPLANLEDELGKIRFWNLGSASKKSNARGVLDPFYMASDKGEILELVLSTISMLLGDLRDDQMQAIAPVIKDVIEMKNRSMGTLTNELNMSTNQIARQVGTQLDMISRLPSASVCFSSGTKRRIPVDLTKGTTIITMKGIDLPSADAKKLSNKNRLALTVFFLVTDFIKRVMNNTDDTLNKTVIIDEAWATVASAAGQETVKHLALLGRSKNLALIMATQTPLHLAGTTIDNSIKTRFAFRTNQKDAPDIVKAMRLPEYGGFESILCKLDTGTCLMSDAYGRYGIVKILCPDKKWTDAFETNPFEKMAAQRAQKAKAQ